MIFLSNIEFINHWEKLEIGTKHENKLEIVKKNPSKMYSKLAKNLENFESIFEIFVNVEVFFQSL